MSRPPPGGRTCFRSHSPPASGGRMGSALNAPPHPAAPRSLACAHRTENSKVALTRLHAQSPPTPRVLSLPPRSRITRSQSAGLRTSCAPGMRAAPGQVPRGAACRPLCGTELRRASSSRPPLPWDAAAAAAASERLAEAVAAICGAEGAARSRPRGGS